MNDSLELISQIEDLLNKLKVVSSNNGVPKSGPSRVASSEKFSGLTKHIFDLIGEGFFKEPKTISEIQHKLRLGGVNKPTSSMMGSLLQLLRKKKLARIHTSEGKGPFKYHQR